MCIVILNIKNCDSIEKIMDGFLYSITVKLLLMLFNSRSQAANKCCAKNNFPIRVLIISSLTPWLVSTYNDANHPNISDPGSACLTDHPIYNIVAKGHLCPFQS
jgi:hypothetical protein